MLTIKDLLRSEVGARLCHWLPSHDLHHHLKACPGVWPQLTGTGSRLWCGSRLWLLCAGSTWGLAPFGGSSSPPLSSLTLLSVKRPGEGSDTCWPPAASLASSSSCRRTNWASRLSHLRVSSATVRYRSSSVSRCTQSSSFSSC